MNTQAFTINVADQDLNDLRLRLARTRWPDQLAGTGWDYGTNTAYLKTLVAHWREGFDWRGQEQRLNALPHFRATLNDLQLHYIHVRGGGDQSVPLLLLHGWPSSFLQFEKIIPLLTNSESELTFDLVIPSLPGYGFSSRPAAPGLSAAKMAPVFHNLMTDALGYQRYGIRSSDLGAGVAAQMARAYPEAIIGSHTGGTSPYIGQIPDDLTPDERRFVEQAQGWMQAEMAYAMLHSTKPQTLAHALNDSPAGLASWIIEKYRRWGDTNGDVESRFSKDELLTTVSLYWFTGTIGSSMRLYYETVRDPGSWGPAQVPVAMLMSSKDMFPTPRSWVERRGPVARWTEIDRGGHFLEQEEPNLVAGDLRAFFGPLA